LRKISRALSPIDPTSGELRERENKNWDVPFNKPFVGPERLNIFWNLILSWGESGGNPGGGDLGIDAPVSCCGIEV